MTVERDVTQLLTGRRLCGGIFTRAMLAIALGILSVGAVCPLQAGERSALGWGHLFSNDALGDQKDRWRTGSFTLSGVTGPHWNGATPARFGSIIEYRFQSEIIAPDNLVKPAPGDRDHVGALSFGVHTHWSVADTDARLGLDMVAIGEQTGLARFQKDVHVGLGMGKPDMTGHQIDNGFYPTVSAEFAHRIPVRSNTIIKPYIEAQAGVETFVRAGTDILVGPYWTDSLLLRDGSTGQPYRGIAGNRDRGTSFVVGGDYTYVIHSAYLPAGQVPELRRDRARLRAGIHVERDHFGLFYGLTWLSREFEGQRHSQVVGSLRIDFLF